MATITTTSTGITGMFRDETPSGEQSRFSESGWLDLNVSTWAAYLVYLLYTFLVYWPVFFGRRFFWEDFFSQEYPIREFSFYMAGIQHALPFWNPYSWAWAPLLADAQNGFWYPTNLLGIAITRLFLPSAVHLPVLIPETMILLHLSIASLGVFYLLKKEFRVAPIVALIAGFAWGFGARMVAEQNHPMQIIQLSLLPWEVLLTMRAWRSWKYAIGLGLLLGISFFAGQPQTFLYIAIFLGCFTLWESSLRFKARDGLLLASRPIRFYLLAMVVAIGVAAIQILPTLELLALSARDHLSYEDASSSGLHLGFLLNFFVPKFYGEYPGFGALTSPTVNNHFWYWEATYYWGALAEILALYGIVRLWKARGGMEPRSRHLAFFVYFSLFAWAFGMGSNLHLQWLFWRFVPFFDHIRAPNRMIWFLWFVGTLATAFGLEELVRNSRNRSANARLLLWACTVFVVLNVVASVGVFDYLFPPYIFREGLWLLLLHSLIASLAATGFCLSYVRGWLPVRWIIPCAALIMLCDLYYCDVTWHRNTLSPETVIAQSSARPEVRDFETKNPGHLASAKLLVLENGTARKQEANLGMFLRLPIEYANTEEGLRWMNPLSLRRAIPRVLDSVRRMEIMGVASCSVNGTLTATYSHTLFFVKLYQNWVVAADSVTEKKVLNDSGFDFEKTILLDRAPVMSADTTAIQHSRAQVHFSENEILIEAVSGKPSVLLVNDLYYPAWKARIDGKPTPIMRAFGSLRAVAVPAGIHRVDMYYDSDSFSLGWKITLGVILSAALVLLLGKKRDQKNEGS